MFLTFKVKPFKAILLPNLILCRNFTKCRYREQSVPNALVDIVRDLVPLIMLSRGNIAALDSGGICSMISFEETPERPL